MKGVEDSTPPLKRTAKYITLPLNRGKRRQLLCLIERYAAVKARFLLLLGDTTTWAYLDRQENLREATKAQRDPRIPVHLHDQAVFDAVHTMRRHIDAALKNGHVRRRLFLRWDGDQRRYGFWLLSRYERIGAVLRGQVPAPSWSIGRDKRLAVVRFLHRLLRRSLGRRLRLRLRRSMSLDSTLNSVFE